MSLFSKTREIESLELTNTSRFDNQLTAIINVRNGEKFIQETIRSALTQSVKVKILVVDNHSTDNTYDIVSQYPEIELVKTPLPCSLGEARNFSLTLVKTDHIAWLDADDIWEKNFALYSLVAFDVFPEIAYSCAGCISIDSKSIECSSNYQYWKINHEDKLQIHILSRTFPDLMKQTLYKAWCSHVFKTQFVREVFGFNTNLNYAEDFDLVAKLYFLGKEAFINQNVTRYRIHQNQGSSTIDLKSQYDEKMDILKCYTNKLSKSEFGEISSVYKIELYLKNYYKKRSSRAMLSLLTTIIKESIKNKKIIYIMFKKAFRRLFRSFFGKIV